MTHPQIDSGQATAPSDIVPAGRRALIASYVADVGLATVTSLASRFGVSSDTVRRDLDLLASQGRVLRSHGGAMRVGGDAEPLRASDQREVATPDKVAVGALAATLVRDDMVIMLNAGATTVALARHLVGRRGLTVVTNNLLIPPALPVDACRFAYLLGGEIRLSSQSTIGSVTRQLENSSLDIRCDLALVSIGGVTLEHGYSTGDLPEAMMMHEMMRRASKVAILADSSKIGRVLFANIADLAEADYFVTDRMPPPELLELLAESNVEVLVADKQ